MARDSIGLGFWGGGSRNMSISTRNMRYPMDLPGGRGQGSPHLWIATLI